MGELTGFLKYKRVVPHKQPVEQRLKHYREFTQSLDGDSLRKQGARCMDCGVPFCHQGCPLGNIIPEWNHLVSVEQWQQALKVLHSTNNFPEFTGRVCPAPCETACVLGINEDPVAIEAIEMAIADKGFANDWIKPEPPAIRTGKTVAIVGSGPAGLAAAQQLNRMGHRVTIFERADRAGGLLMYGIPDFKLEKSRVLRRIQQIEDEGVSFVYNTEIGRDKSFHELKSEHDAVLLTCGATKKRDVTIPGRHLKGIYFADAILNQSTRRVLGDEIVSEPVIATGKDVIVIGGGDTGSDCVGTSNRQQARSIQQFEIMPMPPNLGPHPRAAERPESTPWPSWPYMLRTSTSHEEGAERHWAMMTKEFIGDENGSLKALVTQNVRWVKDGNNQKLEPILGSEVKWPCQMALLAVGFLGPETEGFVADAGIQLSARGNVDASELDYQTSIPGIFSAGDMRRGQSLVVWAIAEGRKAASSIDNFLRLS